MVFVSIILFALIYLATVVGFLWLLNNQQARESTERISYMAERDALLNRIQHPEQLVYPPHLSAVPDRPGEVVEFPAGDEPEDDLHLVGTINGADPSDDK